MSKLTEIQQKLKAPKSQFNKFGNYNYRNCEDILEAIKPLLDGCQLILTDHIVQIGDRFYVQAEAVFTDMENKNAETCSTAYAREAEDKKGMDVAQITGAASSYARKYALNGLFLIDDTKDADSDEPGSEPNKTKEKSSLRKPAVKTLVIPKLPQPPDVKPNPAQRTGEMKPAGALLPEVPKPEAGEISEAVKKILPRIEKALTGKHKFESEEIDSFMIHYTDVPIPELYNSLDKYVIAWHGEAGPNQ